MAFTKPKTGEPVAHEGPTQIQLKFSNAAQGFRGCGQKNRMEYSVELDIATMSSWTVPKFQRIKKETQKVKEYSAKLKRNSNVISGTIYLGILKDDPLNIYLVDGLQRFCACELSGLDVFYADIFFWRYDNLVEMRDHYDEINAHLVTRKRDDKLNSAELSHMPMRELRHQCPFVGYHNVRQEGHKAVIQMSDLLSCWFGSAQSTPTLFKGDVLEQLTDSERGFLQVFLKMAHEAWGTRKEVYVLWDKLNVVTCMILYRQLMLNAEQHAALTEHFFLKVLYALNVDHYKEFLKGKKNVKDNLAECYDRARKLAQARLNEDMCKIKIKQPLWAR